MSELKRPKLKYKILTRYNIYYIQSNDVTFVHVVHKRRYKDLELHS